MREVLETGQRLGTIGVHLHSLFRTALSCAKQARAGTALGRAGASIGAQAIEVAREAQGTLAGRSVLLIGGGEIVRLVAERLLDTGIQAFFIANRTPSVTTELIR